MLVAGCLRASAQLVARDSDGDVAALGCGRAAGLFVHGARRGLFIRSDRLSSLAERRYAAHRLGRCGSAKPRLRQPRSKTGPLEPSLPGRNARRPSRVLLDSYSIEPVNSVPGDARPFVRLWVDEPVTRVTITWDKR